MAEELLRAKKRVKPWKGSMDSLPEEVIGTILSYMASARNVMMACVTSHKWLKAAKEHLHTLIFDESDFTSKNGVLTSPVCEHIITQTVLMTSSLRHLSIFVKPSSASIEFQAAVVTTWLIHTKKALRSLTFKNPIKPSTNILEQLGGGESKLEHLEWGFAYLPALDPSIHRFESLNTLILSSMKTGLTATNLQVLLIVCPKLESLSLIDIHIWGDEQFPLEPTIMLKSSSLKALFIEGGFYGIDCVVLHTETLESLCLKEVKFEQVKLLQGEEQGNLRQLLIENAIIAELEMEHLADSLQEVHISARSSLHADWPKYYQMISGASNLRKLYLSSSPPSHDKSFVDLPQIASTFPQLHSLALTYQHASEAFNVSRSAELIFQRVTVLELSTHRFHTGFARWICEFLKRCPNLKRLTISGKACWGGNENWVQEMADYTSLIIPIMRPYPHIDIKIHYF